MQESSNKEDAGRQDNPSVDSDATSKETVKDLEDTEADSSAGSNAPDPGPSPDGSVDQRDEINDAGPM